MAARSYRMPLVILALLCAATSLVLSAVLMSARASNAESNVFMLEFDTSHVHDPVVNFTKEVMADVGLPAENVGVNFAPPNVRRLYFNDSAISGVQLVNEYLQTTRTPSNLAMWEPSLAYAQGSINLYVQGLNATDGTPIAVTTDMTTAAGELADSLSTEAKTWAHSKRAAFDAVVPFRLRIAGVALLAVGFVGLIVVAVTQGYLPRIALGLQAGLLGVAAVCQLASAGLLTYSLKAIEGDYVPFVRVPGAVVNYRTSSVFLGITWASTTLALVATALAVAIIAQPAPPEAFRPRWIGRRSKPAAPLLAPSHSQPQPYRSEKDGHKSISPPYNHSATVDAAAEARGVVQYPPYAVAADAGPLRRDHWDYTAAQKRYSAVSSLGPSPTRAHF